MRGGDRRWRERMPVDDVDFDGDGESAAEEGGAAEDESESAARRGAPVSERARQTKPQYPHQGGLALAAGAPKSSGVSPETVPTPEVGPRPGTQAPPNPAAASKTAAGTEKAASWRRKSAVGDGSTAQSAAAAARRVASRDRAAVQRGDGLAPAAPSTSATQYGPTRPPAVKQKRKLGLAIATLELDDMFARGDWAEIERFATQRLPMFSVAWTTLKNYESCWKHWVAFQYHARLPILLEVDTALKRKRASCWLLSFVALLGFGAKYRSQTIKKCLMAIRFFHLAHDLDNPVEKCPRVWQGYHAIKRHQGPTVRKHPVTPQMCNAIDEEQKPLGLVGVIKRAARYTAVFVGCRSSEYLGSDIDWDKILLTSDVRPMMGRQYCGWSDDFDGLMITFRGSKTDQYNEGCKRYMGLTGNSRCAVQAFREWYRLQPAHFERSDVVPMFLMPDGRVLGRAEMQTDLRRAALLVGIAGDNIGTHSLRVSCATWLYQAGYGVEYIKRHGRWASNVVHVYLWEGSGLHTMCKRMSECDFVLHTNI